MDEPFRKPTYFFENIKLGNHAVALKTCDLVDLMDKIRAAVKETPGIDSEELAKMMDIDDVLISDLIAAMIQSRVLSYGDYHNE